MKTPRINYMLQSICFACMPIFFSSCLDDLYDELKEKKGELIASFDFNTKVIGWKGENEIMVYDGKELSIISIETKTERSLSLKDVRIVGFANDLIYYQPWDTSQQCCSAVYRVSPEPGSSLEKILDPVAYDVKVSADGSRIAYYKSEKRDSITIYNLTSGLQKSIAMPEGITNHPVRFSYDNAKLVFENLQQSPPESFFSNYSSFFIADIASGETTPIDLGFQTFEFGIRLVNLRWNEDGLKALYTELVGANRKIKLKDFNTGIVTEVGSVYAFDIGWTPDGSKVIYSTELRDFVQIWAIDVTTRQHHMIASAKGNIAGSLYFSQSGDKVAYTYSNIKNSNIFGIYVIDASL